MGIPSLRVLLSLHVLMIHSFLLVVPRLQPQVTLKLKSTLKMCCFFFLFRFTAVHVCTAQAINGKMNSYNLKMIFRIYLYFRQEYMQILLLFRQE